MTGLILTALLSVVLAFLLSAAEAAIWRMSRVRAHELLEEGRPGAASLSRIVADSAAYLSVTAFLRVVAESTAAVLITLGAVDLVDGFWQALLVAISVMALVSFVVVGVSPRTLGREHSDTVALLARALDLSGDERARFLAAARSLHGTTGAGAVLERPSSLSVPPTRLIGREAEVAGVLTGIAVRLGGEPRKGCGRTMALWPWGCGLGCRRARGGVAWPRPLEHDAQPYQGDQDINPV